MNESDKYFGACKDKSPEDYCRVINNLIIYYNKRAKRYKKLYYIFALARILTIALVSVFSVFKVFLPYSSTILSAGALVAECLLGITCAQDKWKSYRRTCDKLCAEHRLYHAGVGTYKNEESMFECFVTKCEEIICNEGERWEEYITQIKVGIDK